MADFCSDLHDAWYCTCEECCEHTPGPNAAVWHAQDPAAKKPEDWDDRAMIDDPEDKKVRILPCGSEPACLLPREGMHTLRLLHPAP